MLGMWIGNSGEGAKYWMGVLAELRNRGVEDVLISAATGCRRRCKTDPRRTDES